MREEDDCQTHAEAGEAGISLENYESKDDSRLDMKEIFRVALPKSGALCEGAGLDGTIRSAYAAAGGDPESARSEHAENASDDRHGRNRQTVRRQYAPDCCEERSGVPERLLSKLALIPADVRHSPLATAMPVSLPKVKMSQMAFPPRRFVP